MSLWYPLRKLHWWDTIHDVFIYCKIEILCMMTILGNRRNSRGNLNINQNSVKWIPQYSKIAYKSQCSLHFWESTILNFYSVWAYTGLYFNLNPTELTGVQLFTSIVIIFRGVKYIAYVCQSKYILSHLLYHALLFTIFYQCNIIASLQR